MEKEADPLNILVSDDAKSVDRQKLAEIVSPYIMIDGQSKLFGFTSSFDDLKPNEVKVEVLLAGAKARALLFDLPDGLSPMEIITTGIMAEGSVKSCLKRLFDSRKIRRDGGRYSLPAYRVTELSKRLAPRH